MKLLARESAQEYYEKCLEVHSYDYLSFAQKVEVFQQDLEHHILKEITEETEFKKQFEWLLKNQIKRDHGKISSGDVPETLVSDIDNLKKWRNIGVHTGEMTKIKYLSHFQTMVQTIHFFSDVKWSDKIDDIISDNQKAYKELTYDELIRVGTRCYKNGKFKEALEFFEEVEKKLQGDKQKEIVVYNKMAETYLKNGDYDKAISHYRKALENCILLNRGENFQTARFYQKIGVVYRKDRQYEEAKNNFVKSENILIKIQEKDPDDPDVANLYNDFGLMYLNEKKFEEAHSYYEMAFLIRENNYKKYGKEEREGYYAREYAYSVHNMGTYYFKLVTDRLNVNDEERKINLSKAAEFHEKAYNIRIDLLDGRNPLDVIKENASMADLCLDIAQSLTLWASDLLELGNTKDALKKCQLGLDIRKAMQSTSIQDIAWSYYTLGLINEKLGNNNEEALRCFSESYRIRRRASNDEHPYAAKVLYNMGRIKLKLGIDKEEANLHLKKALEIQKNFLNGDDPELLDTLKIINELEN
jgi:tetratricopeptide (TPR) repeat protein